MPLAWFEETSELLLALGSMAEAAMGKLFISVELLSELLHVFDLIRLLSLRKGLW